MYTINLAKNRKYNLILTKGLFRSILKLNFMKLNFLKLKNMKQKYKTKIQNENEDCKYGGNEQVLRSSQKSCVLNSAGNMV